MANDNGKQYFSIGLDLDSLRQSAEESKQIIAGIGSDAVEQGSLIDQAFGQQGAAQSFGILEAAIQSAGGKIDEIRSTINQLDAACDEQQAEIQSLNEEYNKLSATLDKNVSAGSQEEQSIQARMQTIRGEITVRRSLIQEMQDTATALDEEATKMEQVSQEAEQTGNVHESLRSKIRELKQEMADMVMNGIDQQSDAYRRLVVQLGQLQDIQGDIQRQGSILANDERQFAGVTSGLQGVTSGFLAAQGALALFGAGNKELQPILQKTYTLMAIVNGLQQVSATLNKDSAFRLTTLANVREWWNNLLSVGRGEQIADTAATVADTAAEEANSAAIVAKTTAKQASTAAETQNTVATGANTAGQIAQTSAAVAGTAANISLAGAFRMVGAAIKSIPVLGWVAAGISAIVGVVALFVNKANEAKKAAEEAKKAAQEFYSAVTDEAYRPIGALKELEMQWKALGDSLEERQKFVEDNQSAFKNLGIAINDAADLEDFFTNQADKFIAAQIAKAKATVLLNQAIEKEKEAAELEQEIEQMPKTVETYKWTGVGPAASFVSQGEQANPERVEAQATLYALKKEAQELEDQVTGLYKEYTDEMNKLNAGRTGTTATSTIGSTTHTADTSQRDAEREEEERQKALQQSGDLIAQLVAKNNDREIANMQEGHAKRMAEITADRDAEYQELEKMIAKFQELNQITGVEIGNNGLTSEQTDAITSALAGIDEKYKQDQQKILDEALEGILTYEQQRLKIQEEFAERRKALYEDDGVTLREGVTQGNVSNLNQQENDAVEALNAELLAQQENYQEWCNMISQLSLEQLKILLEEAEAQLEAAKENGASDEDVGLAQAQVAAINEQIADMDTSPDKSSEKDWTALYKTLQTCEREFERVGDAIGGTAGTIIKTTGQVASATLTVFNSVNELFSKTEDMTESIEDVGEGTVNVLSQTAEGASDAMQGAAKGTEQAISTVEKASVILTIITAALQVAQAIVNLFNNDDQKQKEIDELQNRIDELQWELDNSGAVRIQNELGDALIKVKDIYSQVTDEVLNLHNVSTQYANKWITRVAKIVYEDEILEKSIQKIVNAYATLDYSADKAIGTEKYKNAQEELQNYAEQLVLIQEQYDKELSKKKTDEEQLKEYEQEMDEIAEKMNDLLNTLVEDIIGGSSEEISKQLGDAFVEAFQAGEDAAQAWADTVDDIVQDIVKQLLIQEYIEPEIAKIFDKYKAQWFNEDGTFAGTEAVIDDMDAFSDELNAACGEFAEAWTAISDAMGFASESTREASQKGIAAASQESIDELNGRATAIQGHTFTINQNTILLVQNTNAILQSVMNIDSNTDGLSARMERVEDYVRELRDTTNNIALKGVKVA